MMPPLRDLQKAMGHAIRHGPSAVPDGYFAGDSRRVLLGFAIHANTISHGRLVALEDSFPRCRAMLGDARFNALSREFLDAEGGRAAPLALIGRDFPHWLADNGQESVARLALFEQHWLESYRAAEAAPFGLADIAALSEAALLSVEVASHPAAFLCASDSDLCAALELDALDREGPVNLLITRPEAEIRVLSVDAATTALFRQFEKGGRFGEVLEELARTHDQDAILAAVQKLAGSGALVRI
jgi:hypothetical protein